MKLAVNASPLILLEAADQLELLPALASEIVVPGAVLEELEQGGSKDDTAIRVDAAEWADVMSLARNRPEVAAWDLGAGETAVLSWALETPGFVCVLDDRAARKCARVLNLPVVGTLGIVLAAKEAGLIPLARPVLGAMMDAGYYLSGSMLERALSRVGE